MKNGPKSNWESSIEAIAERDVVPVTQPEQTIEVFISSETEVFKEYSRRLYLSFAGAARLRGGTFPVAQEELEAYLRTFLKSRVDWVRSRTMNERLESNALRPNVRLAVPAFFTCVLGAIGESVDRERRLRLIPKWDDLDAGPFLTFEDMQRISAELVAYESIGFEYGEGYHRDTDGTWEFMSLVVMENKVLGHRREEHTPTDALLASVVGVRGLEAILLPRINYGDLTVFTGLMDALARFKAA